MKAKHHAHVNAHQYLHEGYMRLVRELPSSIKSLVNNAKMCKTINASRASVKESSHTIRAGWPTLKDRVRPTKRALRPFFAPTSVKQLRSIGLTSLY